MIRFGAMSITLMVGMLYGVLFAALLWWSPRNRVANRFLALLLVVIALQLLPYAIGYAGYYDAYPWLSYLPYEASLAFGPLLYFYVRSLSVPDLLRAWGWHFAPAAVQMAYYAIIFPMPLAFKDAWNDEIHVPYLVPLEQAATFISIAAYWLLSRRHYAAYQRWLADHVSDLEEHHINWLRQFLIALAVTLVFWLGLVAFERWVTPLNYFQQFPLYVWWTVLSYYLGTEGYRHAGHRYPQWEADSEPNARADAPMDGGLPLVTASLPATPMPTAPPVPSAPSTPPSPNPPASATPRDWAGRMQIWKAEIVREEMWRDPELSLARLARRLGTNTGDLSRAINEGLGLNFNEFINRLRVDAVKTALSDPAAAPGRNLLDIAFEAGFSSKASFNRSFKLYAGVTPTAFRDRQRVSNRD